MATVTKILSNKVDGENNSQIYFRVNVTRTARFRIGSGIFIPRNRWNETNGEIKLPRKGGAELLDLTNKQNKLDQSVKLILRLTNIFAPDDLSSHFLDEILPLIEGTDPDLLTREMALNKLDRKKHPENYIKEKPRTFFELMDEYLDATPYSKVRNKNFHVLIDALKRYELFVRLTDRQRRSFHLDVNVMNRNDIADIESYFKNEYKLFDDYPKAFKQIMEMTKSKVKGKVRINTNGKERKTQDWKPQQRGRNTICSLFNKLRAFLNWCNEEEITSNRPFLGYKGTTTELYGTPYYLTLEERNKIADFDLSSFPALAVQRDIFIFQCLIGCRVSDLYTMTESNIIDGEIQYVPRKTKDKKPYVVSVPLNERAKKLVDKYRGVDKNERLFPFVSSQTYNEDIKCMIEKCGVTRMVTIINGTTGEEEQRPIYEVASSHMARRTFVGCLYKQVKDPDLICPLSGHVEGSKAFTRYRTIDSETKKDLVKLIN